MQNANWGGAYAGQPDTRYSHPYQQPQGHPQGYAVHQSYGAPQGYGQPQGYSAPHAYGDQPGAEGDWPQGPQGGGPGGGMGRVVHGVGALVSLALIAGLGVWGYQLAMRDVTGVPVVRALEGPMRIQPEDPGGVAAAHQGLAVNTVAAEGQAEGPAAQVALAPAPVALEEEDQPTHPVEAISAASMAEADEMVAPEPQAEPEPQVASLETEEGDEVAAALAMASALASGAQPLSGEESDLEMSDEAEAALATNTLEVIPASVPGVARSPRPAMRPDDIVARAAASPVELALASASAATQSSVREIAATEIAAGTRLVQLGAYDSEEVARAEWEKVSLRFPEMLEGKNRVIEMAQSGGKTFYRLRAEGFSDLSDARRFCAALMAGQAACIPVVTR